MAISSKQLDTLKSLLNAEHLSESLNFRECHGFLCGLACGPTSLNKDEQIKVILGDEYQFPNSENEKEFSDALEQLYEDICNDLFDGNHVFLPCSLELEMLAESEWRIDDSLEQWSYGFLEAYVIDEAAWYQNDEDSCAEMLLPILICIEELNGDDFVEIRHDLDLLESLIQQIPSALTDLYLFYQND